MGHRGPAPTPTNIINLRGNPGKRATNKNEPKPKPGASCPAWLDEVARKEWRRIAPELKRLKLLTLVDRTALAAYCQSYSRWYEAEQVVLDEGMTIKTKLGNVIQHPAVGIANQAMKQMYKFMAEFGMTPAARTRISVDKNPEQGDLFGEWVKARDCG